MYAGLARVTLAERGPDGLQGLCLRLERDASIEAFAVDSSGTRPGMRPTPDGARKAGAAAIRAGKSLVVEVPGGFYVAYPVGRSQGSAYAIVMHPLPTAGEDADASEGKRWFSFLPVDLMIRALIILVLGGIACFFLARYITAPVTRLRLATQRLAQGDLSARAGLGHGAHGDELQDLGQDFDRMAERLSGLLGAQRRLLTDISHELRSPLARMKLAVELMRSGDPKDVATMMPRLELETARLNQLIGDVLTLSRAEAGEAAPEFQSVDLGALVAEVADDARFEAGAQGKEVRVQCAAAIHVQGARELLRSAIDNVLRNAVRYTAAGTAVEVVASIQAAPDGPRAAITVRDHGPGVPAAELERIFEPFYRYQDVGRPQTANTGLGLAIARRVMTRHGGSISAELAPGGGLIVTFVLPALT
jgi:two-component system sensor histidine kinase CpxA